MVIKRPVLSLIAVLTLGCSFASVAQADLGTIGYRDFSYSPSGSKMTNSKPESKLWWNDGFWWASMLEPASQDFHIFKLNRANQTWGDSGVLIDPRSNARADTLWDGSRLYVSSHIFSESPGSADGAKLYRYSYNASTDTYSRDSGFPVAINSLKTETLVIAKDSTGMLWATWTAGGKVYVNHTVGDDAHWSAPYVLPVAGVSVVNDDIATLIAFDSNGATPGGSKIGVMWSNQGDGRFYFASHIDGDPDAIWTGETVPGITNSDDHINLKTDASGNIYAAVKHGGGSGSSALISLLVRSGSGIWASYMYGRNTDSHTRPIVELDEEAGLLHLFATGPQPPSTSGQSGGTIYEKTARIGSISFSTGLGTPVINDPSSNDLNDVTSTKQNVNSTSGLVVMASDATTNYYWHGDVLPGSGGVQLRRRLLLLRLLRHHLQRVEGMWSPPLRQPMPG